MKCIKCGYENPENACFCANCGNSLNINLEIPINNEQVINNQNNFNSINLTAMSNQQPINNQNNFNSINLTAMPNQQPINTVNNNFNNINTFKQDEKPHKNKALKVVIIGVVILVVISVSIVISRKFFHKNNDLVNEVFNTSDLIRVVKDGNYGYIDTKGKFVIEPKYKSASSFHGDYASVKIEDGDGHSVYKIIDKKGKEVFTVNDAFSYYTEYKIWIIDGQLYDINLKKLSKENVTVEYLEPLSANILKWQNDKEHTTGIMDSTGRIIFSYKLLNDEEELSIDFPEWYNCATEKYCRVSIDNKKFAIINCDTGKIVYDFTTTYIDEGLGRIFSLMDETRKNVIKNICIQDDKIIYETTDSNIKLYYSCAYTGKLDYIEIEDLSKPYSERHKYIDSSGNFVDKEPSVNIFYDEWEDYTKITKKYEKDKRCLERDGQIVLDCEWDTFKYLDLGLYKNLEKLGMEYVLAFKDDKINLVDLKTQEIVAKFNTDEIKSDEDSLFIYYTDKDNKSIVVYNFLTRKTLSLSNTDDIYLYSNYIKVKTGNDYDYYNANLEKIYTEKGDN